MSIWFFERDRVHSAIDEWMVQLHKRGERIHSFKLAWSLWREFLDEHRRRSGREPKGSHWLWKAPWGPVVFTGRRTP